MKRFLVFAFIFVLVAVFSGCGEKGGTPVTPPKHTTEPEHNIEPEPAVQDGTQALSFDVEIFSPSAIGGMNLPPFLNNNCLVASDIEVFYGDPAATTIAIDTITKEETDLGFVSTGVNINSKYYIYISRDDSPLWSLDGKRSLRLVSRKTGAGEVIYEFPKNRVSNESVVCNDKYILWTEAYEDGELWRYDLLAYDFGTKQIFVVCEDVFEFSGAYTGCLNGATALYAKYDEDTKNHSIIGFDLDKKAEAFEYATGRKKPWRYDFSEDYFVYTAGGGYIDVIARKTGESVFSTEEAFIACAIFENRYLIYDYRGEIIIRDLRKEFEDTRLSELEGLGSCEFSGFNFDRGSNRLAVRRTYPIDPGDIQKSDIVVVELKKGEGDGQKNS